MSRPLPLAPADRTGSLCPSAASWIQHKLTPFIPKNSGSRRGAARGSLSPCAAHGRERVLR